MLTKEQKAATTLAKKESAKLLKQERKEKRDAEKNTAKEAVNAEKEARNAKHAADKLAATTAAKDWEAPLRARGQLQRVPHSKVSQPK